MTTSTGEHEMGLKKILDFTRLGAIIILILHFNYYCYGAFEQWQLTTTISDRFLVNLVRTGLFKTPLHSKLIALLLLIISMLGTKGKKSEKISPRSIVIFLISGSTLYFFTALILDLNGPAATIASIYISVTSLGFILLLTGGTILSRYIRLRLNRDIFNELNESFPQEERLLQNEYSINLPAEYNCQGKIKRSWINIINPFRSLLVVGTPGSGKSYFVIQHIIRQHIKKGFSMLIYDFKYDDLTKIAYNTLRKSQRAYKQLPQFYIINFDDLSLSHRCNPLHPESMKDITDATESARAILLGLNREWISKQGDFFVESSINFLTAVIWFLKKYQDGRFCTLPHAIELIQLEYKRLFPVLCSETEVQVLINPFISAFENNAVEQLEGQVASAKIGLARLSSPQLYWILSKSDFTLDINNPHAPKIVCLANNPQKQNIYGAVLSLYITRVIKLVNKKDQLKSSLVFDEFPTIYLNDIDNLIATARSNKIATCLGVQDFSQLKKDYGTNQAAVIMNIAGNIISGQVMGETAKQLSERFGKIVQVKESISINRNDTSISKSGQLDYAIPPSKISTLSSGEFVGMVSDDPNQKIDLKIFHCRIINDMEKLKSEETSQKKIPVHKPVSQQEISDNYYQIRMEAKRIVNELISPD
jgi:hypothetical protein